MSYRLTASTTSYFLTDHLGSTNGLADSSGNLTASTNYDAFGNATNADFPTRYQFTGRELDNFTGLHYYRARFYDANLGRFISEDPIGLRYGINLYSYVENQPNHFSDPLGLFPSIYPVDYHQQIGSEALEGLATARQIQSINWSNGDFDSRTQDSIYAPYHAKRRPGQSVEDARDEANDFVRRKICLAREYESRGWYTLAMHELGKAIHTLQDAKSPAHVGFQEAWSGDPLSNILNYPGHLASETLFPGEENIEAAKESTRQAWGYFNGAPMPKNFFPVNPIISPVK